LTISTFGDITIRVTPSGRFEARTRYRDWDGQTRQVQATGNTARAAAITEEQAHDEVLAAADEHVADAGQLVRGLGDVLARGHRHGESNLEDDPESVRAQHANARAPSVTQSHAA
jgi:hypothetical protein